jgi:hypothetical protein
MAECTKAERNRRKCTCSNTGCERHGICCECIAAHRESGSLPSCVREIAKKQS